MTPVPVFLTVAGILFVALLVIMTVELFSQYASLEEEQRRGFKWEREVMGKFLLILLVIVSLIFDLTVYLISRRMPGDITVLDDGYMLVTITCELWLFGAQMAECIANIRTRVGAENIPPVMSFAVDQVRTVLRVIRTIDQQRLKYADTKEPRSPRWIDHLTIEDFHEFQKRAEARMRGESVPSFPVFSVDRGDLDPTTDVVGE